jgi:hypothetical protein
MLISLQPQLSYLLWLPNIHHSQQLSQAIHSTDVLQQIEQTFSGKLIAKISQMELNFSVMTSRTSFKACFNLIQLIDHLWLKLWLIHGCKTQISQTRVKYKLISNRDKVQSPSLLKMIDKKNKMKKKEEWQIEELELWEVELKLEKNLKCLKWLIKLHKKLCWLMKKSLHKILNISLHSILT